MQLKCIDEPIPMLFIRKEECCGCMACLAICSKEAIKSEEDNEGFKYPYIDTSICVGCNMCIKICPMKIIKLNSE